MSVSVCGDVIVTDWAIVVIAPDPTKVGAMQAGARFAGGALGGALAASASRSGAGGNLLNLGNAEAVPPVAQMKRVTTCWPSEVPPELSQLPEWPRIPEARALTFIP